MTGNLDEVLSGLLETALAGLFAGDSPAVTLSIANKSFEVDPQSIEVEAGIPRPDDRLDQFAYDPEAPPASLSLSQVSYPGPRRVRLTSDAGDRMPLSEDEVAWSNEDNQVFSLQPNVSRDLSEVTGVEVLYGVTAVFTRLKAMQSLSLQLQLNVEDESQLEAAEALCIAVIELNRQTLIDNANALYEEGDYTAAVVITSLKLQGSDAPLANQRRLIYEAEIELKASRALSETEGAPIETIRTTSRPFDPARPVNIHIDVDG